MRLFHLLLLSLLLSSCVNKVEPQTGVYQWKLHNCQDNHPCYSTSADKGSDNYIDPLEVRAPKKVVMGKIKKILNKDESVEIVDTQEEYIHAVRKPYPILGWKLDVEFLFSRKEEQVDIKIESRNDMPDFGRYKKWLENFRFKYHQSDVH